MRITGVLILLAVIGTACYAQDADQSLRQAQEMVELRKQLKELKESRPKPDPKFFKLDFVLKEVEGARVLNSRSFSMYSATDAAPSNIRTGVKVQEGTNEHPNWTDIGVRIDVRNIREIRDELAFNVATEITGLPQDTIEGPARAIMRQYIWNSDVLIPIRKPTVIFSSDSTSSKSQMQVELTATPVM
jgi:hypothetical protein